MSERVVNVEEEEGDNTINWHIPNSPISSPKTQDPSNTLIPHNSYCNKALFEGEFFDRDLSFQIVNRKK